MSHKMTMAKLETIFKAAENCNRNFNGSHYGPFQLDDVSRNLFNDFVAAARRDLKSIGFLSTAIYWTESARHDNKLGDSNKAPVDVKQEQCEGVLLCAGALAARLDALDRS